MKSGLWKKTAAGLLALLIVTGTTPGTPFLKIADMAAITARAMQVSVTVESDSGETISLYVEPDDSVGYVKMLIKDETGLAPDRQALYFDGLRLESGNKLSDYYIQNDAVLTLKVIDVATRGKCGENAVWEFEAETGTLTIKGTGAMNNYTSVHYDDDHAEYVNQPWNAYNDDITSVVIGNGITSIGKYAFTYCNMTSIEISDTVTSIGLAAFSRCKSLTSIEIPDSVTSMDRGVFYLCTALTSVKIPSSIISISDVGFYVCKELTSIEIPDSVTSIGESAFIGCTSLTSIEIPAGVTSIGAQAFSSCTNITDVYCYADPDDLTWNDRYCDDFKEDGTTVCHVPAEYYNDYVAKFSGVVNVTFKADTMGKCGDNARWRLDAKTGKLTIKGSGAMYDYVIGTRPWEEYLEAITSVEVESGITYIGTYAFRDCENLASIEIPDGVTSIGGDALCECRSLKSIELPDSVTSIGSNAFRQCSSLTSIEIPDGVTSISRYAFLGCTGLTSIKIPASVTSIDTDVFATCTNITDVYCYADPAVLTWVDNKCNDFKISGATVCHVPAEYYDAYVAKFRGAVNVVFRGDLVDMGLGEHLYGHSITLDGAIGVNFYVELTDELTESKTAKMVFTVPNGSKTETQTLLVKDVIADDSSKVSIGGKTYYKFKCDVSAKDMASEITAQMFDGNKKGVEYTYSVKEYADYLLLHTEVDEYADAAKLVKAMLNYGAYSQIYFGVGGTLANAGLTAANVSGVSAETINKPYDATKTSLPNGVTFEGATLSLKSETTLSLYFNGLPADTKFTCEGKTVETVKNGDHIVARIRGIKASELEDDLTVTFKGGSVKYNAMTYCYNVLNGGSDDTALQNVCRALYLYSQAAKEYFE